MGLKPTLLPDSFLKCIPGSERADAGLGMTAAEAEEKEGLKLEKDLQKAIAQYLRLNEVPFYITRMDKKSTGTIGWPDITFVIGGRACFFECKRPGQYPTSDQQRCHNALIDAGACVWVIYRLIEAIEIVRKLKEETKA